MAVNLRWFIGLATPLVASFVFQVPSTSSACGPCCCIIDGHTRYMWARTWYGPNALATPLTDYFVPRDPENCHSSNYGHGGCQSDVAPGGPNQYGAYPYPVSAAATFEPPQFEHLGKIPNELELAGAGFPMGAPVPPPAPRR
ncbi:MAG TPA: hypothetical protein VH107_18690 [Lacipirellulaceae bacterium]|jgi:hypothetical protein|nr:hypothetical protein [Lacipirellulaceae bacterium]